MLAVATVAAPPLLPRISPGRRLDGCFAAACESPGGGDARLLELHGDGLQSCLLVAGTRGSTMLELTRLPLGSQENPLK